jgi:hypothetical protein
MWEIFQKFLIDRADEWATRLPVRLEKRRQAFGKKHSQ